MTAVKTRKYQPCHFCAISSNITNFTSHCPKTSKNTLSISKTINHNKQKNYIKKNQKTQKSHPKLPHDILKTLQIPQPEKPNRNPLILPKQNRNAHIDYFPTLKRYRTWPPDNAPRTTSTVSVSAVGRRLLDPWEFLAQGAAGACRLMRGHRQTRHSGERGPDRAPPVTRRRLYQHYF